MWLTSSNPSNFAILGIFINKCSNGAVGFWISSAQKVKGSIPAAVKFFYFFFPVPHCTFNHSLITSETIKYFPNMNKCEYFCALLVINSSTDLTERELTDLFKDMNLLYGSLKIHDTNLKSLSFIPKNPNRSFGYGCTSCKSLTSDLFGKSWFSAGLSITNNSQLTNIDVISNFLFYNVVNRRFQCSFQVEGNEKLNASYLCDWWKITEIINPVVERNLEDCSEFLKKNWKNLNSAEK